MTKKCNYLYIVTGVSYIGQKLGDLEKLSHRQIIPIDDLESRFWPDIKQFLIGQTLPMTDGKPAITGYHLKKWLDKLIKKGFDEEIDFSK
jgi:hypothetical protein